MSSLFHFASVSHTWRGQRDDDDDDVDDYDGGDDDDGDFCLVPAMGTLTIMVVGLMFL